MSDHTSVYIPSMPPKYKDLDFSWDCEEYIKTVEDRMRENRADKSLLDSEPVSLDINQSKNVTLENGRYCADIGSAHLEGLLIKGSEERLYVFFDGSRTRNQGTTMAPLPSFLRWSWHQYTKASILCLEDPMFYRYEKVCLAWFYGTEDEDYYEHTAAFIKYIAKQIGVPENKIVLYGPSGGGTAAANTSRFIKGSFSVAVNGQLNIKLHEDYVNQKFIKATDITIPDDEPLGRNNLPKTIKDNPDNHYLFITNIRSPQDFSNQLKSFCEKLDITPSYGLNTFDNLTLWCINAVGFPSTHSTWEDPTLFRLIEMLILNIESGNTGEDLNSFYELATQYWHDIYLSRKELKEAKEYYEKLLKRYGWINNIGTNIKKLFKKKG